MGLADIKHPTLLPQHIKIKPSRKDDDIKHDKNNDKIYTGS
jgi:hypothetical protein